jgi:peptide/nickel transport system permease protein
MSDARLGLVGFVLRRIGQAVPLLLGVVVVNFLIIQLAPGDPVQALVGDFPAPEEYVRQVRAEFGLDRPIPEQLLRYLGQLARGNLGFSFAQRRPVGTVVVERLGRTALLTGSALVLAVLAGVSLGVISSRRPYSWLDNLTSGVSLVGFSLPVFWLGQILILAFAIWLGWFPAQGMVSLRAPEVGPGRLADIGWHLVLPMVALGTRFVAINARLSRGSMLEVLGTDYVRTARAKGASTARLIFRHALPNALLPIVTVIGYNLGFLFAGSALVETVFAWPGVGRLLFEAVLARDYPVLLGVFLVVSVTVIVANLVTDLLYAYLDPRIRL